MSQRLYLLRYTVLKLTTPSLKNTVFKNWVLVVLFALGLLVLFHPAGILAALTSSSLDEYTVKTLDVPSYETRDFKIDTDAFAYAFKWSGNEFQFAINNQALARIKSSHDLSTDDLNYSEMYFGLEAGDTLQIKNSQAKNIELMLINPKEMGAISNGTYAGDFATSGLGTTTLVNKESGADYSELNIVSRESWGADESLATWEPSYKKIDGIIVHHTAWPNDPEGDYAKTVRAIYVFHAQGRGWGDIGYNYLIAPDGTIFEGRKGGAGAIGAHTGGQNGGNIGISLMGDFSYSQPPIEQQRSLFKLMGERALLHDLDLEWGTNVHGHRDWNVTSCPGEELYKILPNIVQSATQYVSERTDGSLAQARAIARPLTINYSDTRLRIEFTAEALASSTPQELLPKRSGIVYKDFDETGVTIAVESIPGYSGDWSDDTVFRMRDLATMLTLDQNVESVERVTDPVIPIKYTPKKNSEEDLEDIVNPLVRYAGPITINRDAVDGEGAPAVFQLVNTDSNEVIEEILVTDTEKAQVFYNRHLNLYFEHEFEEGAGYQVVVCDDCVHDTNSDIDLTGLSWSFEVLITDFKPIYRFWSDKLAAHFYTASAREKEKLESDSRFTSTWSYEKPAFEALSLDQCSKGDPVYRFWSPQYANHFYTISYNQYLRVVTDSELSRFWDYEGIAFCAYDYPRQGSLPVYRFWSDLYKGHFYTISVRERNRVIANFDDQIWRYEQIAFYAMPASN